MDASMILAQNKPLNTTTSGKRPRTTRTRRPMPRQSHGVPPSIWKHLHILPITIGTAWVAKAANNKCTRWSYCNLMTLPGQLRVWQIAGQPGDTDNLHWGPPVPAEELLERQMALAVACQLPGGQWHGRSEGCAEGAGALLWGWQRATGVLEGLPRESGGVQWTAAGQGGDTPHRGGWERVSAGYIGELSDHVGYHVQGDASSVAHHQNQDRLEQNRIVQYWQRVEDAIRTGAASGSRRRRWWTRGMQHAAAALLQLGAASGAVAS